MKNESKIEKRSLIVLALLLLTACGDLGIVKGLKPKNLGTNTHHTSQHLDPSQVNLPESKLDSTENAEEGISERAKKLLNACRSEYLESMETTFLYLLENDSENLFFTMDLSDEGENPIYAEIEISAFSIDASWTEGCLVTIYLGYRDEGLGVRFPSADDQNSAENVEAPVNRSYTNSKIIDVVKYWADGMFGYSFTLRINEYGASDARTTKYYHPTWGVSEAIDSITFTLPYPLGVVPTLPSDIAPSVEPTNPDSGIPLAKMEEEIRLLTIEMNSDEDGDEISDYDERVIFGTNPNNSDTDDDGLGDWEEIFTYGSDPIFKDTDNDGINDFDEVHFGEFGTNPNDPDTDHDGINDYDEIFVWETDPNDPNSGVPERDQILQDEADRLFREAEAADEEEALRAAEDAIYLEQLNADEDPDDVDGDGLSNEDEMMYGTDPYNPDTDGNGILDGDEIY